MGGINMTYYVAYKYLLSSEDLGEFWETDEMIMHCKKKDIRKEILTEIFEQEGIKPSKLEITSCYRTTDDACL